MGDNKIVIDLDSKIVFDRKDCYGDVMDLDDFIECCHDGSFIDYDGYASEIIIGDFIVYDDALYPSDYLGLEEQFKELQRKEGRIEIVWYNR